MTIPSTARKAGPLLGTGAQTAWPFTFKVFAAADIAVTIANSAGTETPLVLGTDYSVTLNPNQDTSPGGTVTYPISGTPLAVGSKLSIVGDIDYDQPLDLPSGGNFSPLALENELDRVVMQIQQLSEESDRAVRVPVTSDADGTLPVPEAQKILGWDINGTGLQNYDIPALFSGVVYADWVADTFAGNGTQTVFVLQRSPGAVGNCDVSVDGQTYVPIVDFSLSGATLTFTVAPTAGAEILVRYGSAATQVSSTFSTESQTATAGQTVFALNNLLYSPGANALAVYVNGLRMVSGVDLLESNVDEVTFTSGLTLGDEVLFIAGRTINESIGAEAVSYLPGGTGAVATTAQAKLRESVSVKDFGAVGDGITDDTAAIQNAINTSGFVFLPSGNYRVTSTITLNSGTHLVGTGRSNTTITSEIVGASLFQTVASSAAFIYVGDMKLVGNGLTGASGNGHAINFIDPAIGSGTFTPQNSLLERLWITGFKGLDVCTNSGSPTISSAAVVMYDTLAITCRNLVVTNCGHGFYLRKTQNCRIEDCVVDGVTKYALLSYQSDNLILTRCDFIDAGDGVTEAGYPNTTFGSGIVVSNEDFNFVLQDSKIKNNRAGGQAIRLMFTEGAVIDANWIRADAMTDVQHRGIYAERCSGLRITNNTFDPSITAFSATRKYEQIELYNSQTNETFHASIEGNVFGDVSGMDIAYNIKVGGNANTRSYQVTIRNNKFGYRSARSSACVIDADVVIASCAVRCSEIVANTHYAPANVTRTLGYQATTVTLAENRLGPNEFRANSGTITAEYSGLTESLLEGSATYDPPSLIDAAGATTTITVTGAALGDFAEASFSRDLQGITATAWVSATDTVSVRFQNETGGTLDLLSGTLRARVRKL